MTKHVMSILSPILLLLLAVNMPIFAQTELPEIEPAATVQSEITQPETPLVLEEQSEAEPPAPVQSEITQPEISPVLEEQVEAEPPAPIQPAITQPEPPPVLEEQAESEPSAPVQPVITPPEPPPVLTEQSETEPSAPILSFEPERPKAKPRIPPPPHSSAFVFPAGYVSYNLRGGYRKYDGVDEYQYVERNGMFIFGGMLGKRFALKNRRVRFQAAIEAGWGSKEEDAYDYESDNTADDAHEYINLSTFGIQTDMHILFPDKTRASYFAYFLSVGPGLHRTSFSFSLKGAGDQTLWKSKSISMVSPSFNIGAGMEYTLSGYRALSLAYNFRIWNPVNYVQTGDLFPMGVQYEEVFYSHALYIQMLLPGTKKGSFR